MYYGVGDKSATMSMLPSNVLQKDCPKIQCKTGRIAPKIPLAFTHLHPPLSGGKTTLLFGQLRFQGLLLLNNLEVFPSILWQ